VRAGASGAEALDPGFRRGDGDGGVVCGMGLEPSGFACGVDASGAEALDPGFRRGDGGVGCGMGLEPNGFACGVDAS